MFNDATITADREWAARLFEGMVSKGIDLAWNCSTGQTGWTAKF